ncbi:PAS domain S-box protein [Stieleria sp. ICT_E10.1]|uniref:two-component system sensor histidine kinase NtrB n=1 Tax=Stieleria sedimenti TaxID=2976331 RepID=UPI00217F6DF9|nr:PAS domain S-box protein [Stieleria sedimenti]MCS7466741.1 PAS domain S-box protein [Stieleria sedimenti]
MHNQDQAVLLAILEAAVDAIIVIDSNGVIQTANPATIKLFGFEKSEMLGQNVNMLMPSPFREQHDGYLANYLKTGEAKIIGIGREVIGKRKNGSTFPMHLAVSRMAVGDQILFAGIVRDITDIKNVQRQLALANEKLEQRVQERTAELRAAQADLLKSERMATLGQVSGGIAHEIRNPLNAVRTSVYYLRNVQNPSPEKVHEHLERIDRQVSMIDNVITALSDIARMPEPAVIACDVKEMLRKIVSSVSMPANIQIETTLPDSGFQAAIDPNQVSIVFRNLLRNARDAMPDGGTISIAGQVAADELVIQVSDTGIGIKPDDLARVVEPLFSTKARGMGLGLAISVAILKKNQGRLEVESQLGKGTTFSVYLKPFTRERPSQDE